MPFRPATYRVLRPVIINGVQRKPREILSDRRLDLHIRFPADFQIVAHGWDDGEREIEPSGPPPRRRASRQTLDMRAPRNGMIIRAPRRCADDA